MKTRKRLHEILDDIEATIPEAKERHADEAGFFMESVSQLQVELGGFVRQMV